MAQWVRELAVTLRTRVWSQDSTGWEERTDSHTLCSDFYKGATGHRHPPSHAPTDIKM